MRRLRAIASLGAVLFAVSFATAAGPVRVEHVEAELVSESDAIVPGKAFTLALRLKHDPEWHTQWLAAAVEWTLPDGFVAGPIQWPGPEINYYGAARVYSYSGETFLLVEITPPSSVETGTKVELAAKVSWWTWKGNEGTPGEADLALDLPVAAAPGADTLWSATIRKTRATCPSPSSDLAVAGYRDGKQITLVVDAARSLNPEASKFYFFENQGLLRTDANYVSRRTSRQVRIDVRESEHEAKAERLSGVLRAKGGWFQDSVENHSVEFAVIDGAPPPIVPFEPLASVVLRNLESSPEYRALRALYIRRRNQAGDEWVKSVYGRRLLAALKRLRAEAASATTVDPDHPEKRVVNFTEGDGRVRRLSSMVPSLVDEDESYHDYAGVFVCRLILEEAQREGVLLLPSLPPAAQEEFKKGIDAAKEQNYLLAVSSFEAARAIPYYSFEYGHTPRAPEIYFNLGLAESKLPGHELRAIAWFGAYLTANPYAPAPNEAAVLEQMKVLYAKNQSNLSAWLQSVQDAAGKGSAYDRTNNLYHMVIMRADAGDIAGAQGVAALIPSSEANSSFAYHAILNAQLKTGDLPGALKTARIMEDRLAVAIAKNDVAGPSGYAGLKTETAFTLAQAQTELAEAHIKAGDQAGGKKYLAAAQKSAALIRYATYESKVQPVIAEVLIKAGDPTKARAVLTAARITVDRNPEPNAKISELVGIARAQLRAGDTTGAGQTFSFARDVAGPTGWSQFAAQMAVAQALGGDMPGALSTIGQIKDNANIDFTLIAIAQAQVKSGDFDGASTTAGKILWELGKSRVLLAIAEARGNHGRTVSDWLRVLEDNNGSHVCALNQEFFTDFAGYLNARRKLYASVGLADDYSHLSDMLRSVSETKIDAHNAIGHMISVVASK